MKLHEGFGLAQRLLHNSYVSAPAVLHLSSVYIQMLFIGEKIIYVTAYLVFRRYFALTFAKKDWGLVDCDAYLVKIPKLECIGQKLSF